MPSDMAECGNPRPAPDKVQREWKRAMGRAPRHCRRVSGNTHSPRPAGAPARLRWLVKSYRTPPTARAARDGKRVKHVACWLVKLDLQPLCAAKTVLSKRRVILPLTPPTAPFPSSTLDFTLHVAYSPRTARGPTTAHSRISHCFPPTKYLLIS